ARNELAAVLENRSSRQASFDLDLDGSSAMGPVWFTFVGTRIPGASGQTERITGVMRMTTERQREAQRLTYLATRDELTGHLNRTSLRSEIARAIEISKAGATNCAYLVAAIDRLAVINEAYGFGAADEVIVTVGERLASALRASDVIGRIAGNKLGIILGPCTEAEM